MVNDAMEGADGWGSTEDAVKATTAVALVRVDIGKAERGLGATVSKPPAGTRGQQWAEVATADHFRCVSTCAAFARALRDAQRCQLASGRAHGH